MNVNLSCNNVKLLNKGCSLKNERLRIANRHRTTLVCAINAFTSRCSFIFTLAPKADDQKNCELYEMS